MALAESLAELILAFRLGGQISQRVPDRDLFNERLTELVAAHLSDDDRYALQLIQREGSQGLSAARQRAGELARDRFNKGDDLLETLSMSGEARLCAESFFWAQKAYFVYTQSRHEEAVKLIERAFLNDLLLESRCGVDILLMHRVQLLNNFMRIEARSERWLTALLLGNALLQYLEEPSDPAIRMLRPPWNRGWIDKFAAIPADLLGATHAQIAREEIQVFHRARSAGVTANEICSTFSSIAPDRTNTQIGRWMNFQIVRLDASRGDYFSAASAMLRRGCVPSEPLWHSVAEDVTGLLRPGLCIQATAS